MRLTLALYLFLLSMALALPAGAQTFTHSPDSTRYVPLGSGTFTFGGTFDFPEPPDSLMIDFGFEARSVTIVHRGEDLIVEPIRARPGDTIVDPGIVNARQIYASTRFDAFRFVWSPDTLAVADSTTATVICCGGFRGLKIVGLTSAGDCKVYATTEE